MSTVTLIALLVVAFSAGGALGIARGRLSARLSARPAL